MVSMNPKRIISVIGLVVGFALLCGFFLFRSVVVKGLKSPVEGLKSPVEGAQPEESCRAALPPMAARCCSKVFPILEKKDLCFS